MTLWQQFQKMARSRKFWVLVLSLATIWTTFFSVPGALTILQAVQGTVGALSIYALGVAIEGPSPDVRAK